LVIKKLASKRYRKVFLLRGFDLSIC
jgi:hypothetical protein